MLQAIMIGTVVLAFLPMVWCGYLTLTLYRQYQIQQWFSKGIRVPAYRPRG